LKILKIQNNKHMNIGFVIINSGRKGGAEKRFFNIFNTLKGQSDIYLLTNRSVIDFAEELGIGFSGVNVEVLFEDKNRKIKSEIPEKFWSNDSRRLGIKNIVKKVTSKRFRSFMRELFKILRYNKYILKWAIENKLDVINSLQPSGIFTVGQILSRTKTVFSYVDCEVRNGYPFYWIKNMGLKTVFKLSDAFDFLSPMISRRIEAKGLKLKRHKVNVAPNSFIDFDRILIEKKDPKRIVFSGRMEKIKNPILALEAVKILQKRGVDFELFLLGRGTLEEEIKHFIEKNKLSSKVHFYFEPNIERILATSSIYLSLQDINNYPSQALLEAMASECAIIATDVEETSWLVDEEVGFLVGKNPLDIAGKVHALISNHELSLKLGQKARERVVNKHNVKNY